MSKTITYTTKRPLQTSGSVTAAWITKQRVIVNDKGWTDNTTLREVWEDMKRAGQDTQKVTIYREKPY